LVDAIRTNKRHGSEANKVVEHFNKLTVPEQQKIAWISELGTLGLFPEIGVDVMKLKLLFGVLN
jgi:hypothetical protein